MRTLPKWFLVLVISSFNDLITSIYDQIVVEFHFSTLNRRRVSPLKLRCHAGVECFHWGTPYKFSDSGATTKILW